MGNEDTSSSPPRQADGSGGGGGATAGQDAKATPQQQPNTIDLKLLSPSPEVPASGLFLENLPISITLGELRSRITASLASHPPPARQRLIYFGRVLQRDDDTLASVFGENSVQQQRQHTLHLVLPLREGGAAAGGSQREAAPSPVPSVRASIYPPSSIPRPSSVPPRGTGTASPFRGPVQWQPPAQASAPTSTPPTPLRTPQASQPPAQPQQQPLLPQQPLLQQPQPRAQAPLDQPIFRSLIGNANIRANITANGQPINLPPEVVNQLLNQHFLRNGGLEHLLPGGAQARPQSTDPASQAAAGTPPVGPPPTSHPLQASQSGQQLFQQFMASVQDTNRHAHATGGGGAGDGNEGQDQQSQQRSPRESEDRGRQQDSQASPQDAADPPVSAPSATDGQQASPGSSHPQPGAGQSNGSSPTVREQSGVNSDGTRWSVRTIENLGHAHHGHNHTHAHAHRAPQMPQMQAHMQFPFPLTQGFPFQAAPGMHIPLAAPATNLRPHAGTPRSASPARSVSEGPRRIGTPAAELQHRLMHTNHEIQNLNQLLGVLAQGTMADGQPAPPLSDDQVAQIRVFAQSMNSHIDAFGNDLNALANAHPSVRFQPEFAGLSSMFQAVQGQGRGIANRIDSLGASSSSAGSAETQRGEGTGTALPTPTQESTAAAMNPLLQATAPGVVRTALTPPASQSTPSTTSDTLSPSLLTRECSPQSTDGTDTANQAPAAPTPPEIHLLSDPTSTQHFLLVGPTSATTLGQLPLDVLYPLLAAQLPHDRLVRDFNRASQEMVHALQRQDLRTALAGGLGVAHMAPQRHASNATDVTVTSNAPTGVRQPGQTAAAPGAAAADPANPPPAAAPAAGPAPAPNAQARQQPDEMRDVLAPVVRNLWLLVRLCIFGWFFFSSGRGYGRLAVLLVLGGLVWCINAGVFGRRINGLLDAVQRHFQEVVDEARGVAPAAARAGNANANAGEGSSRGGNVGTPEDAARRIMVQRAEGQRRRVRDVVRRVERTVALGFASLWPGVGEAVVRNHERARREAERLAEEERRRVEEERARAEEEAQGKGKEVAVENGEGGASGVEVSGESAERVNKGKERATEDAVD